MSNMYGVIGTSQENYLLADPQGADVIAVPVEPGNGEIKRGTLLYRAESGLYKPAGSSQITTSNYLVVLSEDVNTGENSATGAIAEDAASYRGGRFISGKVMYNNSGTLTEVTPAHKAVLRLMGILFDVDENAGEFANGGYKVTYIANNGKSDEDVVKTKTPGVAYTVLGNSDSALSFAAPDGKTFSKWNTKADGSGTDYATGASYATDADLTLYAVWA